MVEHPYAVEVGAARPNGEVVLMFLGDDVTGRALEVAGIVEDGILVVLHVMDMREKFRVVYEAGKEGSWNLS